MHKPTGKILGLGPALLLTLAVTGAAQAARHHPASHRQAAARQAATAPSRNMQMVQEQVLLDRAGFSPGVIDGRGSDNTEKALHAFQQVNGLPVGPLDQATAARLAQTAGTPPALSQYTIAPQDVAGPFVQQIPKDFEQMAALPRLDYQGPRELLAEKFHMSEDLLAALNPGKDLAQAGTVITVANVGGPDPAAVAAAGKPGQQAQRQAPGSGSSGGDRAARIVVDKRTQTVAVYAADNRLLAFYPATVGSTEKPAPSGTFQVRDVVRNPDYTYNPAYGFKGQHATQPVKIPPGPNNPVGLVWIGLNAKGYGIHGTPDPDKVGKTQSHGCVRLTNWDALALARLVKKGTQVDFVG